MSAEELNEELLEEKTREKLEDEHGEICAVRIKSSVFAFRLPTRPEVKMFRQKSQRKNADSAQEMENLLVTCCVHPSKEALAECFDKYSMAVGSTGVAFTSFAGMDYEALAIVK